MLKFKQNTDKIEKKLGQLIIESMSKNDRMLTKASVVKPIDSLLQLLCEKNNINTKDIQLHILKDAEANAFALPDKHLVIYTGLLTTCKNQEELCGVLAHELAHIQKNHVMQKLVTELGLTILISTVSNSSNLHTILQTLSSSAYSRTIESEADQLAVTYLQNAKINPEGLANFLYKMAEESALQNFESMLSSHPQPKERAMTIIELIQAQEEQFSPIKFDSLAWKQLQKEVVTDEKL
jgi:predicted Zn-dependent protease